jgi:hypothetical protein
MMHKRIDTYGANYEEGAAEKLLSDPLPDKLPEELDEQYTPLRWDCWSKLLTFETIVKFVLHRHCEPAFMR